MTAGEVKKALQELVDAYQQVDWILGLHKVTTFLKALDERDDTALLTDVELKLVQQLINNLWQDAIAPLAPAQWQIDEKILPLRHCQKRLEEQHIISTHCHHPVCFSEITTRFNEDSPLQAASMSHLLKATCRIMGYADQDEIPTYPSARIAKKRSIRSSGNDDSLKCAMTHMAVLFYLLYYHVTPQQRQLIPLLIYYRKQTTDEERRSELALLDFLSKTPREAAEQMKQLRDFIDYGIVLKDQDFTLLKPLLPGLRKDFLAVISPDLWHIKANQNRCLKDKTTRLVALCNVITEQFIAAKLPFENITTFCQTIKAGDHLLVSNTDRQLLNEAFTLFMLEQYKLQRESEGSRYSFFSQDTKKTASLKKAQAMLGVPVNLSLLERLASNQGRLGELETGKINFTG